MTETVTQKSTHKPVPDSCVACGQDIMVPERSWEFMRSNAGKVICANTCEEESCQGALEDSPRMVIAEISRRQKWLT